MIIVRFLVLLILVSAATFVCRANETSPRHLQKCINYEPEIVSLFGSISRRTVINLSDQKETIWILKLAKPVCVNAAKGDEFNVRRTRVTDVQLALEPEMYTRYRHLVGKKIKATGSLFGEQTAHHFTPVLLKVVELSLAQ